jgi:hypothetical protein
VGSSPTGWSTVKLAPGGLAVITCPVTAGGDTSSQLIGFDLSRRTPTWRVSLP